LKTLYTTFGVGKKHPSYIKISSCPSPNHYNVKRLYEEGEVPAVAKNSGR
jgi:hypothetical protein